MDEPIMDAVEIMRVLPHRHPFLFVDRVVSVEKGVSIVAEHLVSMSDPILQGHFPDNPIVPGVVQIEAMAQAAIVLAYLSDAYDPRTQLCFFIGIKEAKFRAPAVPGEVLRIEVRAERLGRVGRFSGEIRGALGVKSTAGFTAVIERKPAREASP
jgi:3-hydroxyacyl-[acyl-carrier-protein] dehydratase